MGTTTARPSTMYTPASDRPPEGKRRRLSVGAAVAWGAVLAVAAYFVVHNFARYVTLDATRWGPYWWPRVRWLVPHMAGGLLALVLGPLQFRTAFRRRHARLHRWSGRAYVASIALGAAMAAVLLSRTGFGWVYAAGLTGLATALVGTTALAVTAIRRGNVAQHREWMVRSYVVTFAFVSFRLVFDALGAAGVGTPPERLAFASWSCWAVPLLVTELVLQGRKVLGTPRRALPELPE